MNFSSFLQRLPAARVLRKTKDSLVAVGAKDRFNQLIRPYGRVLDFQLNTQERTVFASFRLKGEVDALQFWVHDYQVVEKKKGETFIVVDGTLRCSFGYAGSGEPTDAAFRRGLEAELDRMRAFLGMERGQAARQES